MAGGLAGILIVDPETSYTLPNDLNDLYNGNNVYEILFQYINFAGNDTVH